MWGQVASNRQMKAAQKEAMFAEVIDSHQGAIYRLSCAYVRNEADRQDVLQEILIHVWNGLGGFHESAKLSTWVFRISINTCLTWLRKEKRRGRMLKKAAIEQKIRESTLEWQHDQNRRENLEHLHEAIFELEEMDRLLVALYLEGMASAEVASILGISAGNCRIKLHRIKKQLGTKWREK